MIIYALVRFFRGYEHGYQGDNDKFDDKATTDFLVKHFEERVNLINNTRGSVVLHLHKLVENEDGTPKLDSEGNHERQVVYVDKQYLDDLSNI